MPVRPTCSMNISPLASTRFLHTVLHGMESTAIKSNPGESATPAKNAKCPPVRTGPQQRAGASNTLLLAHKSIKTDRYMSTTTADQGWNSVRSNVVIGGWSGCRRKSAITSGRLSTNQAAGRIKGRVADGRQADRRSVSLLRRAHHQHRVLGV